MNCTSFRKYVGAFADGELDTKLNLDALEHLNMCPDCARRVSHVQELKAALKRVLPVEGAPADLIELLRILPPVRGGEDAPWVLTEEQLERLRALGYVK